MNSFFICLSRVIVKETRRFMTNFLRSFENPIVNLPLSGHPKSYPQKSLESIMCACNGYINTNLNDPLVQIYQNQTSFHIILLVFLKKKIFAPRTNDSLKLVMLKFDTTTQTSGSKYIWKNVGSFHWKCLMPIFGTI